MGLDHIRAADGVHIVAIISLLIGDRLPTGTLTAVAHFGAIVTTVTRPPGTIDAGATTIAARDRGERGAAIAIWAPDDVIRVEHFFLLRGGFPTP